MKNLLMLISLIWILSPNQSLANGLSCSEYLATTNNEQSSDLKAFLATFPYSDSRNFQLSKFNTALSAMTSGTRVSFETSGEDFNKVRILDIGTDSSLENSKDIFIDVESKEGIVSRISIADIRNRIKVESNLLPLQQGDQERYLSLFQDSLALEFQKSKINAVLKAIESKVRVSFTTNENDFTRVKVINIGINPSIQDLNQIYIEVESMDGEIYRTSIRQIRSQIEVESILQPLQRGDRERYLSMFQDSLALEFQESKVDAVIKAIESNLRVSFTTSADEFNKVRIINIGTDPSIQDPNQIYIEVETMGGIVSRTSIRQIRNQIEVESKLQPLQAGFRERYLSLFQDALAQEFQDSKITAVLKAIGSNILVSFTTSADEFNKVRIINIGTDPSIQDPKEIYIEVESTNGEISRTSIGQIRNQIELEPKIQPLQPLQRTDFENYLSFFQDSKAKEFQALKYSLALRAIESGSWTSFPTINDYYDNVKIVSIGTDASSAYKYTICIEVKSRNGTVSRIPLEDIVNRFDIHLPLRPLR